MRPEAEPRLHRQVPGKGRAALRKAAADAGHHPRAAPPAEGDVRCAQASRGQEDSEHRPAARAPRRARQGQGPGGVRPEVRCQHRREGARPSGEGLVRALQRVRSLPGRSRTLQETHRTLPGAGAGRQDLPDQGEPCLLPRTWHRDVRTRAGAASQGRQGRAAAGGEGRDGPH